MSSDTLPPKVEPESLPLRARPRAVTRLNRRVLAMMAGVAATAILGTTFWSLTPRRHERSEATELYNVDRITRADDLERLPRDYADIPPTAKPPPVLGPPLPGDLGPPILKMQQSSGDRSSAPAGRVDAAQAERLTADDAARSPVFFRGTGSRDPRVANAAPPAAESASGLLGNAPGGNFVPPAPGGPGAAASSTAVPVADATVGQNLQQLKEAFLDQVADKAARNTGNLQLPSSPYTVMAGTIIPTALATGINSDLPGQVIATVTEGVYDTASGRYLLIPQGSRLMGRYDSQVAFGQRRVLLAWTRIVLPDASSIALDRLPGIDSAGYAGLEDGVDWHWDRILASAALSTLLGVGSQLATPDNRTNSNGNQVVIDLRQSAEDTVNQVGQEITRRNMNIQPTLTIRPGFPLAVMVSKDLVLRPYQALFFQRGSSP